MKLNHSIGSDLFKYSGVLWTRIYKDRDMLQQYYTTLGLLENQTTVLYNEAKATTNRHLVPLFSDVLWLPVELKANERNTVGCLYLGDNNTIGETSMDETVVFVNRPKKYSSVANYPIHLDIVSSSLIVDNIERPEILLSSGLDYEIKDGVLTLFEYDPLGANETKIIWLNSVKIDRNIVGDHLSYVYGYNNAKGRASYLKNVTNAIWDISVEGPSPSRLISAFSALYHDADIKYYDNIITSLDEPGFVNDTKSISIPVNLFSAEMDSGLIVTRDIKDISIAGYDKNNNPKLWFELYGNIDDVKMFWEYVWDYHERNNISMLDILDYDYNKRNTVDPVDFVLRNILGYNTSIIVVDQTEINTRPADITKLAEIILSKIPLGHRLIVIEKLSKATEIKPEYSSSIKLFTSASVNDTIPAMIYSDITVSLKPICGALK